MVVASVFCTVFMKLLHLFIMINLFILSSNIKVKGQDDKIAAN